MQLRLTKWVKIISIACLGSFLIQQTVDRFIGGNLLGTFALVPSGFVLHLRFWQIVTYMFLHGDVSHLVLNLMMLVFIGSEIEALWGARKFLFFYFFCGVSGGLAYLFLQIFLGDQAIHTPMVGASAGIYGLLLAYGLLFSERVLLFMMIFPMKAKHFIWVLAAVEFLSTIFASQSNVASIAHLGGMIGGIGYLWGWAAFRVYQRQKANRPPGGKPSKKKEKAGHLKLVVNQEFEKDKDGKPKIWH